MHAISFKACRDTFAERFQQWIPRRIDEAWISRFVDRPSHGWDIAGLQAGFIAPLYRFFDAEIGIDGRSDARHLRPALACKLMAALAGKGGAPASYASKFDCELVALELHWLASVMLDHIDNGRDLESSVGEERELALPVLITTAYTTRQLAAALLWRHSKISSPQSRRWLSQRFSRLLFLQGIGHTLDLCGPERKLQHASAEALAAYLRWYLTPMDFELVCNVATAAVGLPDTEARELTAAGSELGLAWHCARWARDPRPGHDAGRSRRLDQPIRWRELAHGSERAALSDIADEARANALSGASRVSARVAEVFEEFLSEYEPDIQAAEALELAK